MMTLENKNSTIIPWDFDPNDVSAWEQKRFDIQHNGDKLRFGGSELSSVMNHNKYDGAFYLFQVKLGNVTPKKPNIRMCHGNSVESILLDYVRAYDLNDPSEEKTAENYLRKTFIRNITKAEFFVVSEDYPCLAISLDGVLKKGEVSLHDPKLKMPFDTFVEVKNVSFSSFNSWGGNIPLYYYDQLQGGLAVTGAEYCYFVALVDNAELWIRKVDANPEWFEKINEESIDLSLRISKGKIIQESLLLTQDQAERDILTNLLVDLEPDVYAEQNTTGTLKDLFGSDDSVELIGDEEQSALAVRYLEINKEMSALTEEKTYTKNQLLHSMRGASKMECFDGVWVKNSKSRFTVTQKKG